MILQFMLQLCINGFLYPIFLVVKRKHIKLFGMRFMLLFCSWGEPGDPMLKIVPLSTFGLGHFFLRRFGLSCFSVIWNNIDNIKSLAFIKCKIISCILKCDRSCGLGSKHEHKLSTRLSLILRLLLCNLNNIEICETSILVE